MRTTLLRLAAAALVTGTTLTGCLNADDEYRKAVPTDPQVTVAVPSAATHKTQSLPGVGALDEALLGQTSEYYQFTYDVSTVVNTSALALLGTLRLIVAEAPTSHTPTSRTWGPYTPGGLDPLTYRSIVSKIGNDFTFSIDARPRASSADADFLPLLDGQITPAAKETGSGHMTLHFDNGRALRPTQCEQGTLSYVFDDTRPAATLDVSFAQFANNNPNGLGCAAEDPHDATYHYSRTSDGAGDFVFAIDANVHKPSDNKPKLEAVSVHSRWLAQGAGRADVRITGGEVQSDLQALGLGTEVDATECWDATFATIYEASTPAQLQLIATAGDSSKCAFTAMQLP